MAQKFHEDVSNEDVIWVFEEGEIREVDVSNIDVYSIPVDDIHHIQPEEIAGEE